MKVGIVGMPNAGKSSLFNALTRAGAEAANYPFTTVEPNVAVVPVRDERLDAGGRDDRRHADVSTRRSSSTTSPAWCAARTRARAWATASWRTSARPTRSCTSCARTATRRSCTPRAASTRVADIETIETELLYADLEQAERRLEKVAREAKRRRQGEGRRGGVAARARRRAAGRAARRAPCRAPAAAPDALRNLSPLTAKPVLYVANVDEGEDAVPPEIARPHAERDGARAAAVSARIEAELSELDDDEAAAMRDELGVGESGLDTVVREAWELLGLIAFFTADGGKEGRARAIPRGRRRARRAAGAIHTDIERGFVAAEVIGWEELVDAGGYAAARERAMLRVEGRDYELRDGDVMNVRFNV